MAADAKALFRQLQVSDPKAADEAVAKLVSAIEEFTEIERSRQAAAPPKKGTS